MASLSPRSAAGLVNDPEQKKSHQVDVAAFGSAAEPLPRLREAAGNGDVRLIGLRELYP
jgi:hypothetical protein